MSRFIAVFFAFVCINFLSSCGDSTPKCPHGDPTPMFSQEIPLVSSHSFQLNSDKSVEDIGFESGLELQILQEGCESVTQDFRFTVKGDYVNTPDSMWMKEAARQFYFLGSMSEKTKALEMWGGAIEQARAQMRLGQPMEVGENIFITIDKVVSAETGTLLVTLGQGE